MSGVSEARRRVVVLGPGLMGAQIGVEFALHRFDVTFLARDRSRGEARIATTLQWAQNLAIADHDAVRTATSAIGIVDRIDDLPQNAELVIESLPEDMRVKVAILREVASRLEVAVLGSNTSSLRIGDIGDRAGAPERTVGIHYWNPPLLMPLVEVTPGPFTDPMAIQLATRFLASIGKVVVPVGRDVPGLIWNRLQFAILREALWLVEHGVTSIPEVDVVVRQGLARRWRHVGLFESIRLGGPETWEQVAGNLFPELSTATSGSGLAGLLAASGAASVELQRRRDEGLARDSVESELSPSKGAAGPVRGTVTGRCVVRPRR